MTIKLNWRALKGLRVRVRSAIRCLTRDHYVLVCWDKAPGDEMDFTITHKGVELPEAVHRLREDAAEILQDICDQEDAMYEVNNLLK